MERGEMGLGATVILLIVGLAIGCGIQMSKADNCREAGWEWHWVTEQCLPKK
jgi:hypothetical protein